MAISYAKFKRTFGDLGVTEWVKFNWLSNAGIARSIYNKVVEAGYNPLAYVNDGLYNHITKTINIWDEEWESGYIDDTSGNKSPNSEFIRTKNYIKVKPNNTYYRTEGSWGAWYDENKVYISGFSGEQTITAPSNAKYLLFTLYKQTTYNHDICINESNPYINGNYFPYFEGEKFLVLVGNVDLSSLIWGFDTSFNYFTSDDLMSLIKPPSISSIKVNAICEKYVVMSYEEWNVSKPNFTLYCSTAGRLRLKTDGTSTTTPSGYLYYQLATPVLVDL